MSIKQEWQRKWREALGEPTDSMPDIQNDYALHFDIWDVGDAKLQECFSLFPNGDRLLSRVNVVRKTFPQSAEVTDEDLLKKLDQLNESIDIVLRDFGDEEIVRLNGEKATAQKRSVYRGNEALRREVLKNADSPTVHLDDELCDLSEPLYQLSGCYYTVSHWIAWAMVEKEYDVDPYQAEFELYKIKAQAGWSNDEQFVYIAS